MPGTSNANDSRSVREIGLFRQIAMFSASGFAMSMAFVLVGDLRIIYPWF
jgi:hypothetical protein